MRNVRLIPCLDVDAGRVVKGVRFVDLVDAGDPVELAAKYDAEGADELTFLDITASAEGRDTMVDVVARTAEQVFIPFTVGGGVRTAEDARSSPTGWSGQGRAQHGRCIGARPHNAALLRVRGPMRRGRHRRPKPGSLRLGGLHPWGTPRDRDRRAAMGTAVHDVGRR